MIQPGDSVIDIGCPLAQYMRRENPDEYPERPCIVSKVFSWGFRVYDPANPEDEWDCENWKEQEEKR
jgi:hypothetical protein